MEGKKWSISDVVKKTQIEPHVLRYWEKELHLNIPRNEFGYRYYLDKHIELFKQIHEMKEGGFQLKAIKTLIPPDFLYDQDERNVVHAAYSAVGSNIPARDVSSLSTLRGAHQLNGQEARNLSNVIIMSKAGDKFEVIKGNGVKKEEIKEAKEMLDTPEVKQSKEKQEELQNEIQPKDKKNITQDQENIVTKEEQQSSNEKLDNDIPTFEEEKLAYLHKKEETLAKELELERDIREKAGDLVGQSIETDMSKVHNPNVKEVHVHTEGETEETESVESESLKKEDQTVDDDSSTDKNNLLQNNGTIELENNKIMQFKGILSDVIVDVLDKRDEKMGGQISDRIIKQMDYLMRLQEQMEDERFKRLDETIRLYQKEREAVGKQKHGIFNKLSKKRAGH